MSKDSSITKQVEKRLKASKIRTPTKDVLSRAARDALVLSEQYSFIEAEPYILPLDMGTGTTRKKVCLR